MIILIIVEWGVSSIGLTCIFDVLQGRLTACLTLSDIANMSINMKSQVSLFNCDCIRFFPRPKRMGHGQGVTIIHVVLLRPIKIGEVAVQTTTLKRERKHSTADSL
jgi:hypothetical protein